MALAGGGLAAPPGAGYGIHSTETSSLHQGGEYSLLVGAILTPSLASAHIYCWTVQDTRMLHAFPPRSIVISLAMRSFSKGRSGPLNAYLKMVEEKRLER